MAKKTNSGKADLLFVDDDEDFRSLTARNFCKRGYAAQEAGDGDAAIYLMEKRTFDVVILDISMPGRKQVSLSIEFVFIDKRRCWSGHSLWYWPLPGLSSVGRLRTSVSHRPEARDFGSE